MAAWSRAVLAYCDAMCKDVAMMQNQLTGYLRIGAMPTLSPILPFLLNRVRSEHPGIRVDVQFIGNEAMRRGLNDFSLDVAIAYLKADDFGRKNILPLFTDSFVLLVPDKPAFRHLDTITWKEAAQVPLAMLRSPMDERRCTDKVFRSAGCSPAAPVESEFNNALILPNAVHRIVYDYSVILRLRTRTTLRHPCATNSSIQLLKKRSVFSGRKARPRFQWRMRLFLPCGRLASPANCASVLRGIIARK